ncbi:Mycocerosic acid synthase [Marinibacterium anthonyi]|nr:Mycocerosic acid synthase [Marinibacterium anthonyi]
MTAAGTIAVVGMACRFPGADTPGDLAQALKAGRTAIRPFPAERRALWTVPGAGDLWPMIRARHAGLIDGITDFDRRPFRISANEAPLIDPQQRLVLETGWHALEDAGLSPARLEDAPVGVFVGAGSSDYTILMAKAAIARLGNPYLPNGGQNGAISGRVSYCLGLIGPSCTIDTACSSALSAVAAAGDALLAGRCDMALAGGVSALLSQDAAAALSGAGPVLSTTGETRSFDAAAAGYVRGEGCGMVVLKRLDDAVADGDRIHAVLPGWATGQDGRTNGLSAPSRAGQVRVIRDALARARLGIDDIGYVEGHGSATALGDTIEMSALGDVFAGRTAPACTIGSIKATMGHLEAAAGIAGLIKAIVMVRDGFIPAQPCFDTPTPRVPWADIPFEVARTTRDWTADRRIAGVSSFGMSGLNAHVLVAAHDCPAPFPAATPDQPQLFMLSAATGTALAARAAQLSGALAVQAPGPVAAAACHRWTGMPVRAAVVAATAQAARARLTEIAAAPPRKPVRAPARMSVTPPGDAPADWHDRLARLCPAYAPDAPVIALPDQPTIGDPIRHATLAAAAALSEAGAAIAVETLYPRSGAAGFDLPGYPFERERAWFDDVPGPRTTRR